MLIFGVQSFNFSESSGGSNTGDGITLEQLNRMLSFYAKKDEVPNVDNYFTKDQIISEFVSHEYLIDNYDTTPDIANKFDNRYIRLDKKFPNFTINYWNGNSVSYNCKAEKTADLSKITGQAILYRDEELNVPFVEQKTIYDVLTNAVSKITELETKVEKLEQANQHSFGYIEE